MKKITIYQFDFDKWFLIPSAMVLLIIYFTEYDLTVLIFVIIFLGLFLKRTEVS